MRKKLVRVVRIAAIAAYAATWVWGIPAVHTRIASEVIESYKAAIRRHRSDVQDVHPRIRFGASYAVIPFVTVNHFEYQYAGLAGWGGFTVDVWYVTGTKTIFGFAKWIS